MALKKRNLIDFSDFDNKRMLEMLLGSEKGFVAGDHYEKLFSHLKRNTPFDFRRLMPHLTVWYQNKSPQGLLLSHPSLSLTDTQEASLLDQLISSTKPFLTYSLEEIDRMLAIPYLGSSWRMLASFPDHMLLRSHYLTQGIDSSFLQDYTSGHCTGESAARHYLSLARKRVEDALVQDGILGKLSTLEVDKSSNYFRVLIENKDIPK